MPLATATAQNGDELIPGPNVNMVSGTVLPTGDPYLQRQNEPSIAVSTRNPLPTTVVLPLTAPKGGVELNHEDQ
ncbi:hypothetical protein MYX75_00645 [Acidobacteria bacterium AH-259-A15]|nr:hypothetical protein [Acidobacteria bacterium AH-259-A15]